MSQTNRRALLPGSFDPPTLGHADILAQAAALFDGVIVAVARNTEKSALCTVDDRVRMLARMAVQHGNVSATTFEGLTAEFARRNGVTAIVRGVRNARDLEYEREIAQGNRALAPAVQTVLLLPATHLGALSSRLVREVIRTGGTEAARPFVPPEVFDMLVEAVDRRREEGDDT